MQPTLFDFNLNAEEESRAKRLHDSSIIIDLLFQGPLSPSVIPLAVSEHIYEECQRYRHDPLTYSRMPAKLLRNMAVSGTLPEFQQEWYESGITAGNREVEITDLESLVLSMGAVQEQFDAFDWLIKAKTAGDIRRAKAEGKKAGIVSSQNTVGLGRNLELLEALHAFGLRLLQLTYNQQDFVGSGCAEPGTGGLSSFGRDLVLKLNDLGILVDTGHCGKQTTLDACSISRHPVVASHTGAEAVYHHMRCKSDEELRAIAATGGVVGVFAMPWFIHSNPNHTTIEHFLDHVDYMVTLLGASHVGIGTDWPMSDVTWSLVYFKEHIAPTLGFQQGTGPSTETVQGLEHYGSFINITRGLVRRGYSDDSIEKLLGGNWLRVFEQVCG